MIQVVEENLFFSLPKTTQPSGTDRISTPDGCLVSYKAVYLTGVTSEASFSIYIFFRLLANSIMDLLDIGPLISTIVS